MEIRFRSDVADKFGWRCTKCCKRVTLRSGTFFEGIRISFIFMFRLISHWALQTRQVDQVDLIEIDRKTVGSFQQRLRQVANVAMARSDIKLGGPGRIVEIDESLFIKVKHNRGKDLRRPQVWVFGMYERPADPSQKGRCLFVVVPKRDARTLLSVINQYIASGTCIFSDCWRAYNQIPMLNNYEHRTVNHTYHFVNPGDGTHTNSIESVWNSAKIHLKSMRGVSRSFLSAYINEFIWRRNNCISRFEKQA